MEEKIKQTVLPNPELTRLPIVRKCDGCEKIFTIPATLGICICYEDPSTKWRHYRMEKEMVKKSGKDVEVIYHYNPCPMATHIRHSPKEENSEKKKLNPIKYSKRK